MVESVTNTDLSNIEVEQEHNENVIITVPFDPNDVVINTPPTSMGHIIDRLEHGEIKLDTEFQRHPDLWNDTKKSRFIESILLKLPVPAFYFDAGDDNLWRIIDGLQRISTIKSFVIDEESFKLQDLEFLKEYNEYNFHDLPRTLQRRIKTFPITANVLGKRVPNVVKYNIFNRINQGGLKLKPQEMRHALHQGKAADLVADLVRADNLLDDNGELKKAGTEEGRAFVQATNGKIKSDRMQDRDFANRFIAFYLISYTEYAPDLDSFLSKGMAKINKLSDEDIEQLKNDFKKAMNTAYSIFGDDAFRKRYYEHENRKPINKALFEVLSVSFAKLSTADNLLLMDKKEEFYIAFMQLHLSDGEFVESISAGTARPERVTKRFKTINRIIQETLNQA